MHRLTAEMVEEIRAILHAASRIGKAPDAPSDGVTWAMDRVCDIAKASVSETQRDPIAWAVLDEGSGELVDVALLRPEEPGAGVRFEPLIYASSETSARDAVIEEVAKDIESAPLTYAGPDPHVASDLRYLIVSSIRDMKGKKP